MRSARARWTTAVLALLLCSANGATAIGAESRLTIVLDSMNLGAIGIERPGESPLVPLDALARALGWRVSERQGGAVLTGEDRTVSVVTGSRAVRENDESRIAFAEPVSLRSGRLYVRDADAARLFALRETRRGGALAFARPADVGGDARIVEVARTPAPRPRPTPRPLQRAAIDPIASARNAGRLVVSLDRSGGTRVFGLTGETQSGTLATALTSSGVDSFGTPNASVRIGSSTRNVTLGNQIDPLSGTVFRGSAYEGIAINRLDDYHTFFAGRRLANGTQTIGETSGDPLHGGATTFSLLAHDGRYEQTIVRRFVRARHPWGDFTAETVAGDRGAAIGFGARTRGRTFLSADAAFATHGLPVGADDPPISVGLGRELSAATTIAGGFSTGVNRPLFPYLAASTRAAGLVASLTATNRTVTANLAYQTANAMVQAYAEPGASRMAGLTATVFLKDALVEFAASSAAGRRDTSLTARTTHRGLNLVGGLAAPSAGGFGPVAGISVPLGPLFAVEGTVRPISAYERALRLALIVAIPARRLPALPTVAATVRATGNDGQPLRLFVDGVAVRRFTGSTVVTVARGAHVFAVATESAARGSFDREVRIEGPHDVVELTLLPVRAVRGRIVVADGAGLPADIDLGGISVALGAPDNLTETAADGTFVFPSQPVPENATIAIDPHTLPAALRAPEPQPADSDDVTLLVRPALRVERQTFPAAR